jgi:hypothetical protein
MFGFFHPRFPVIELHRSTAIFGWVYLGKQPKWQQIGSIDTTNQNYQTALVAIKKNLSVSGFFVLLADEICYTSTVDVPLSTQYTRQYLFDEYIRTHIPEEVAPEAWDFKLNTNVKPDSKEAIVIVPVQHIWQPFVKACGTTGLTIIATEPVSLASQRHSDPHIGIALKPDLSGKDKDVLNIPPAPSWFEWLPFSPIVVIAMMVGWVLAITFVAWLIVVFFG